MKRHLGWDASAEAWINSSGEEGDKSRKHILDPAVLRRLDGRSFKRAIDVGCGEGRFCRLLQARGIDTVGIDLSEPLILHARSRDPSGDYRVESGEKLSAADAEFDLAICYLSLIDIPDFRAAISELVRVMTPGATLLVVNLTSFNTAGHSKGWRKSFTGKVKDFVIDDYSAERATIVEWGGIRVENWHRPLDAYMQAYLGAGLNLVHYEHPMPNDDALHLFEKYPRAPWFNLMEWRKPLNAGEST